MLIYRKILYISYHINIYSYSHSICQVCILRSKAIRCSKTGKFKCPVPGCSIAGCSRVGVAKHFRRHHRDYRSWRDVFLNKDAPHFVLKSDFDGPTNDQLEKNNGEDKKNSSIENEVISCKSTNDDTHDKSESVVISKASLVNSDNDQQSFDVSNITPQTDIQS